MAHINGLAGANGVQYLRGSTTPQGGSPGAPVGPSPLDPAMRIVDGTPIRVVVLALSAAAGLTALRWAGFKFNVAVSS